MQTFMNNNCNKKDIEPNIKYKYLTNFATYILFIKACINIKVFNKCKEILNRFKLLEVDNIKLQNSLIDF